MAGVPRRLAALVAATCAVGAVAGLAAGCASVRSTLKQVGKGAHNPPGKTYAVTAPVRTVTIDAGGTITVTGTRKRGPVRVTESPSYSVTPPSATHTVKGSALTLGYTCKSQLICSVSYDVTVPRGTAVHVDGHGGSVTLTSLSGPVTAQTSTGLISATGLSGRSAALKSDAGGINATFTAPPASVQASTDVGSVTIGVPGSAAYQVNADAIVGVSNVSVRHAASTRHVITAHSDLGDITVSPS
ncbi:MAG: DUF4097 family beta strand repeat protein [Nocardiopsaceae bacterium]|nr:DUF4097 family beta strand repeat protein [Nocardiopsaceae bacterium]